MNELVDARYRLLCCLFLRLSKRGALTQAVEGTDEAVAQFIKMEEVTGVRELAPLPPPPKTPAQLLDDQIIEDYAKLPTDQFKKKLNGNAAYRAAYQRLADTDQLNSQLTTLHDGYNGRVGG